MTARMHATSRRLSALAIACLGIHAAGCHRPAPPEGVTGSPIPADEREFVWDAAIDALRMHQFIVDRQDVAAGLITTLPVTSQQWWEFWRQDVADAHALGEASLHTTQRKATVRFTRSPDDEWAVEVQVDVYRLSTPEYQVTSASSAIQGFSGVLPTAEGRFVRDPSGERRWVHLGRDGGLEARLLRRILHRADVPGEGG